MKTTQEVFKETLDELGFSGYKPNEMTNSDYWLCTQAAMESYASQFKTKWVKVDYALPESDVPFLVIDKWGYMSVCGYNLDIGWYPKIDGSHPNFESKFITHWRLLPELP